MRTGRSKDALGELGATIPPFHDHAASAIHQFLLGTTLGRLGTFDDAREALANADAYATSTAQHDLITEAAYYRALDAFMRGDLVQAEDIASETLDERSGSAHARLLEMRALAAALRGDVDRPIALLLAANEHLARMENRDAFAEGAIGVRSLARRRYRVER